MDRDNVRKGMAWGDCERLWIEVRDDKSEDIDCREFRNNEGRERGTGRRNEVVISKKSGYEIEHVERDY